MSTNQESPFMIGGASVDIAATTTSADETISAPHGRIVVTNTGNVVARFRTGVGAQTALVTDYPILPSTSQTLRIPTNHDTAAAITASGSTTIVVTPGMGE